MSSLEKPGHLSNHATDAAEVGGRGARRDHLTSASSFEETYPQHEFSELVRLGLVLGGWIARRRRFFAAGADLPSATPPGPIAAAD